MLNVLIIYYVSAGVREAKKTFPQLRGIDDKKLLNKLNNEYDKITKLQKKNINQLDEYGGSAKVDNGK